jgi:Zn-dependent protease with chaperone function
VLANPVQFWGLILGGVLLIQFSGYSLDRICLGKRWTFIDLTRVAFWSTIFPTATLLLTAMAFESFYAHLWSGVLWLGIAGIVAVIGAYRLRVAQGVRLQRVKSGEVYKRAFALAKQTGTSIKRVYVVPSGRGHLTNAYGLPQGIAITDNYGKFLHDPELGSVIGHELGHVRQGMAANG